MPQTSRKHTRSKSQRRINSHPRSWWLDHYQAWQSGDLSKSAYCAQQGLNVSSFSNWTRRFARESGKLAASPRNIFFKAETQTPQQLSGRIRTLSFQGLALTFEEPIHPEVLAAWMQVIKTC
jgi:hypothetical protein